MIILDEIEYLGFVDVSGIGHGMKNSVRVEGKVLPVSQQYPPLLPSSHGIATETGPRRKDFPLLFVQFPPDIQ
jgi:hypothetical protein